MNCILIVSCVEKDDDSGDDYCRKVETPVEKENCEVHIIPLKNLKEINLIFVDYWFFIAGDFCFFGFGGVASD